MNTIENPASEHISQSDLHVPAFRGWKIGGVLLQECWDGVCLQARHSAHLLGPCTASNRIAAPEQAQTSSPRLDALTPVRARQSVFSLHPTFLLHPTPPADCHNKRASLALTGLAPDSQGLGQHCPCPVQPPWRLLGLGKGSRGFRSRPSWYHAG